MNSSDILNDLDRVSKLPYPGVKNVRPNIKYANLLLDDFASNKGELTAVTQYIREHIVFDDDNLKNIMLKVAIMEMKHLDLVGDLIKKMGGDPKYINSQSKPWNSTFVAYDIGDLEKIMLYNIKSEQEAIMGYQYAMQRTRNPEIISLLRRIILDEQTHIKTFNSIIKLFNKK